MSEDVYYSRPRATAARLGELAEDRHRFLDKSVLVTGEPAILATANGRECLLASLRLLVRVCRNVFVALPSPNRVLTSEGRQICDAITWDQPVVFLGDCGDLASYDAILSVGAAARPELPWTVINSNGWLARVSSGSTDLPADCTQTNPIGALAAASLGVCDVFKRLLRLRPSRGKLLDGTSFSLFTYGSGESDLGPVLPEQLTVELLLVGAGAIGNGVIYLLSRLPLSGRAWVVDAQAFGPENLGTCLLIGPAEVGKSKALLAAEVLNSNKLEANAFHGDLATFMARLGNAVPFPPVVLGCLDDIPVRHALQQMWADLIIDGAIGDFGCQVSRHPWERDVACLICLFRELPGEPAEQLASRASGLSPARVQQASTLVTAEDVRLASSDQRDWLRAQQGRRVCSVVQEAVALQLSIDQQRRGFEPSVPFVACLSASMVVAELVKFAASWPSDLEPRFQFDVLHGPALGQPLPQQRRPDCLCVTRRRNIEAWRRQRSYQEP